MFPSKRLWSGGMHAFWLALATVGSVSTVGVLPLFHLRYVRARRKAFGGLFERGEATRGVIRSVQSGPMYATFTYQFDVDGNGYVASMDYAMEMAGFWGKGDQVPVLFDPDDPRRSCFVYR